MQSGTIGKLAEALSKTQGEMKAPAKTKTMKIPGRGDYRYADLADVIESRKVGAKYGLSITQGMEMREGDLVLSTMLMHLSGEWKSWDCPIPAGLKPQELGSYLTYMRRYSECGAWGIAAEDDDDGKSAHDAEQRQRPAQSSPHPAASSRPSGAKPECPNCGTADGVIASKFKEGEFVCYDKKGGCGLKFKPGAAPAHTISNQAEDPFGNDLGATGEEVPF